MTDILTSVCTRRSRNRAVAAAHLYRLCGLLLPLLPLMMLDILNRVSWAIEAQSEPTACRRVPPAGALIGVERPIGSTWRCIPSAGSGRAFDVGKSFELTASVVTTTTTTMTAEVRTVRDLYLWCMSVIYLFAFTSLFVQIPGKLMCSNRHR